MQHKIQDITMAHQITDGKAEYVVHKRIDTSLILLRRIQDGELFLGCVLDEKIPGSGKIIELEQRGAGSAFANLLNHENIVNLQTGLINNLQDGTQETIVLWDWCDAGTLEDLFKYPPVRPRNTGFLPEGLVWHVALGILRALQWLHEGIREEYTVRGPEASPRRLYRCHKIRRVTEPEEDWWPVLHRDIRPENIFFQRPKGFETYGAVKLGNFGRAFVSGAIEGPVVATEKGDASLRVLRERRERWAGTDESMDRVGDWDFFCLGVCKREMLTW